MSKAIGPVILMCVGFGLFGCQNDPNSPDGGLPRALTSAENQLIRSADTFGFKLFSKINQQQGDNNIFISPLSVSMALGMTYNGAAGETEAAMRDVLELGGMSLAEINESCQSLIKLLTGLDPKVIFQIANSIWYRQEFPFEKDFLDINKKYFDAEVTGLDFSDPKSVDAINDWVYENTNGKIKEIIKQINPLDLMFLINAIYFKGTWTTEFNKDETRDDKFNLADGSTVPCKMMIQTGDFRYFSADDFQAVDLPYGEEKFSMTLLLPKPEKDIGELAGELDKGNWNSWLSSLSEQKVTLQMPKFTLEYELPMNGVLIALGMGVAFDGRADFTKMYKPGGIWIDEVRHKTFVEVGEEGTEAAAVTIVRISTADTGVTLPISMRVDRPFLFVIHENYSGTILFMGKVVELESN